MVKVYGADWCRDTKRALKYLDDLGIDYQYIDVEQDAEASEWVKNQNGGKERKPTITIGENTIDEQVLSVPDEGDLSSALRQAKLIS
jgi:glutaredoxin